MCHIKKCISGHFFAPTLNYCRVRERRGERIDPCQRIPAPRGRAWSQGLVQGRRTVCSLMHPQHPHIWGKKASWILWQLPKVRFAHLGLCQSIPFAHYSFIWAAIELLWLAPSRKVQNGFVSLLIPWISLSPRVSCLIWLLHSPLPSVVKVIGNWADESPRQPLSSHFSYTRLIKWAFCFSPSPDVASVTRKIFFRSARLKAGRLTERRAAWPHSSQTHRRWNRCPIEERYTTPIWWATGQ